MKNKEKMKNKIKKRGKLERKILICFIIFFFVSMVTTLTVIFVGFYEDKVEMTYDMMRKDAEVCTMFLAEPNDLESEDLTYNEKKSLLESSTNYAQFIDNWLENGADEHYEKVSEELTDILSDSQYNDIFIYKAKTDKNGELLNDMVMVYDAPSDDGSEYRLGDNFGPSDGFDTVKEVYETGRPATLNRTAVNNSGLILVAYAPIKYRDGTVCAVIGLEYSANKIIVSLLKDHYLILLNTLVNFLLCGILGFVFIQKHVVKPVTIVSYHMKRFVSDENALEYEPITDIHTNDEIEQIADDFNTLAQRVIEFAKHLEQKTSEKERLRLDLDVTNQIRSVISSEIAYPAFPERTDFDLYASLGHTLYNKCSFFNYFFTQTDHLFIVLGESLGNSLSSMIFSMLSLSFIKSTAQTGAAPCKIAFETNNHLCSNEKKDSGMTMGAVIVDIDLKSGIMKYVNAGMPPILIKRPGENYVSDNTSQPFCLGQMHGISFEQRSIQLCQGSAVLFTSFGITEMSNDSGVKYGIDRLVKSMNDISGSVYMLNDTVKMLEEDVEKFRNNAPLSMDTAVLAFRYFG